MFPTEDLFVYVYVLIHDLIIAGPLRSRSAVRYRTRSLLPQVCLWTEQGGLRGGF